jgi:hypothetical protein
MLTLNVTLTDNNSPFADAEINTLCEFLKSKYQLKEVEIEISEALAHHRLSSSLTFATLNLMDTLKIHVVDYLARFSLENICTPRGDNRLKCKNKAIYYPVETSFRRRLGVGYFKVVVVSAETVLSEVNNALLGLQSRNGDFPTSILRLIKKSQAYATQEKKGDIHSYDDILA